MSTAIRAATARDVAAINAIYNEAVLTTVATFDTEVRSVDRATQWFEQHQGRYPVLVCEHAGVVRGWASLSQWSDRKAYNGTAETSFYVGEKWRGQGVGRRLLTELIIVGGRQGLHTLLARMAEGSDASLHLHRALGFQDAGYMKEVGFKFGRWIGVHTLQYMYR